MTCTTDTRLTGARFSPLALVGALIRRVETWWAVAKERRALKEMGWSRLEDLGLTDRDVKREARKPFWMTRRPV